MIRHVISGGTSVASSYEFWYCLRAGWLISTFSKGTHPNMCLRLVVQQRRSHTTDESSNHRCRNQYPHTLHLMPNQKMLRCCWSCELSNIRSHRACFCTQSAYAYLHSFRQCHQTSICSNDRDDATSKTMTVTWYNFSWQATGHVGHFICVVTASVFTLISNLQVISRRPPYWNTCAVG